MTTPPRPPGVVRGLLAVVLALGLSACGGGSAQNRPLLVGSYPPDGSVLPTGLTSVRLDFDDPVHLFLVQYLIYSANGVSTGVLIRQDPGEDHSVRVEALPGQVLGPGNVLIQVLPGLVLNSENHYAFEPTGIRLTVGGSPSVFLGSPTTNQVTEVDGETFALKAVTATPGGRDPVGILAVNLGGTTRVFVQLAAGGGTGQSLAVYAPGAATMTALPLTPSAGADLVATQPALALSVDGRTLYAAYRDTLTQRVRLHRVRVLDGVETGVLVLSPAAGATTAPTSLQLHADGVTLLLTCREGATGRLCYVDEPSFTEIDHDTTALGVQGAPLDIVPGAASFLGFTLCVAPTTATTAALTSVSLGTDVLTSDASTQTGTPSAMLATYDAAFVIEGLAAPGAAPNFLALRSGADLTTDTPLPVSTLVGLVAQPSTSVRALTRVPGQRSFLVLLDSDVLARFSWGTGLVVQDDLDGAAAGIQAASITGTAPGSTCLGILAGAYPP